MVIKDSEPTIILSQESPIPARIFRTEANDDPDAWFKTKAYPSHAGAEHIVMMVIDTLGVSKRALNRLLGVPMELNYVWDWLNGRRRPSALYLCRMMILMRCQLNGAQVLKWNRVDWDTGEIEMRPQRDKDGHLHSPAGRDLLDFDSQARSTLASPSEGYQKRASPLVTADANFRAGQTPAV